MKYQQLKNLECGWRLDYLKKKALHGENITMYIDTSEIEHAIQQLERCEQDPTHVEVWIEQHMNPELDNKLKQVIRARRKRYFNAEQPQTRKKSIDLTFDAWQQLSEMASEQNVTLSEMIALLIQKQHSVSKIKHR